MQHIYIPRALNTDTCIQQGDYFILRGYIGTGASQSQYRKDSGGFGKMQVNGPERTKSLSKHSMYSYVRTYSRFQWENL